MFMETHINLAESMMDLGSLHHSRWAPGSSKFYTAKEQHDRNGGNREAFAKSKKLSAVQRDQLSHGQDYEKFCKLLRRLKWKSTTLLFCHHRAMSQSTDNVINGLNFPITSDTGKANAAEIMFKVDFFEFYALLERILVHLLGCFGMIVTADNATVPVAPSSTDLNRSMYSDARVAKDSILGDSRAFYGYAHRFHANVLAAFDLETNPLHQILGTGKVRQYLGLAKEFRNRWKEVEVESSEPQDQIAGLHRSYHQILIDLKLDEMLAALLSALDQAKGVAYEHLPLSKASVEINMMNDDDEDYAPGEDMMVDDAMEWD